MSQVQYNINRCKAEVEVSLKGSCWSVRAEQASRISVEKHPLQRQESPTSDGGVNGRVSPEVVWSPPMMRSFDEVADTQLTTLGPSSVPPEARNGGHGRATTHRKTLAWSDNEAHGESGEDNAEVIGAKRSEPKVGASQKKANPLRPVHKLALFVVLLQAAWALFIPIKNISTVIYPTTRPDSSRAQSLPYMYSDESNKISFSTTPVSVRGTEIEPLLQQVLAIVLGDDSVRDDLLELGSFDIDAVFKLLSLEDFAVLSQYYALIHQSSEFPGGRFTPRSFRQKGDDERLTLVLRDSTNQAEVRDMSFELACFDDNSYLHATRCSRDDGYPCDSDTSSNRNYVDVDMKAQSTGTGLENNIALLYVVDYFHQVLSAVFVAKDWSSVLEDLNYDQTVESALSTGTSSAYKNDFPYLLERDSFLVGVQAARMDTLNLESCVAAELVVGQFYVRTFVLQLVHQALQAHGLFNPESAAIVAPGNLAAIMRSVFQFNVTLTSGARSLTVQETRTRFFNQPVAHLTTFAAQFKFDRRASSADQVSGSSMRLLQQMVYYPDLMSLFASEKGQEESTDTLCDSQSYKLIGWVGSDLTTFRDSYTGNSMMAYHLAELPRSTTTAADPWWDEEVAYAKWFADLENTTAAPYLVFDAHLKISSAARVASTDDDDATRCQRALFKVVGKIAYLALLELSKPASYLMFMSEVSTGARNWLLNQIYSEQLVWESFSGSRVAFSYRNGPSARKDDGSAWVAVPLLNAMLDHYGKDATAAALLQELDSSLKLFLKASNGNIHFPDASTCRVSGETGTAEEVSGSDSLDGVYTKILPGLQTAVLDLLDRIPSVAADFQSAIVSRKLAWVSLSADQVLGSPAITNTTEGHGAPGDWQATAFTVGMLKLWPPKTPTADAVARLRAATVCYKMLDVRSWNATTRCFAEPSNTVVLRSQFRSETMRKFFLSNWSMAIMLNTMAGVVVLKYLRKLMKAWDITKFECLDFEVALQLNLQGMGVLNISQSLLLLAAAMPALIGFHIPLDPVFMPYLATEEIAKPVVDIFVTLSMSWFIKLGFDVCNGWIKPKRPVDWYHLFRVRWLMMVLILIIRWITPDGGTNGAYMMGKLLLTCVISLALGACCTVVIFLPERPGKVVDADRKESHDTVVAALVKQNMPLTRYGVLGRTSKGWSKTGLLVEGWRLGRTADGDEVLRKDGGEILLPRQRIRSADVGATDDCAADTGTTI